MEDAGNKGYSQSELREKIEAVRQQAPIFNIDEWNNIVGIDMESPDFELAPGFVLMDVSVALPSKHNDLMCSYNKTPGFAFEDLGTTREFVSSVRKATRDAIEEADALIYVTERLPNIKQIQVVSTDNNIKYSILTLLL